MKDLPTERYEPDVEGEEAPSSMELALRMAMDGEGFDFPRRSSHRQKRAKHARDRRQDEIISRTLRERHG